MDRLLKEGMLDEQSYQLMEHEFRKHTLAFSGAEITEIMQECVVTMTD